MASSTEQQVIELIRRSEKILILPSSPPDGDSIGSAIALYLVLQKIGKNATVVCSDSIPEIFQFLPGIKNIGSKLVASNDFIISLNCDSKDISQIKSVVEDNKINIIITKKDGQISESDISFNRGSLSYDLIITVDTAELTQLRSIYDNNPQMFFDVPVINIDHHISNNHFGKINLVDIMAASTTELLLPVFKRLEKEFSQKLLDEDIATLLLTGIITDTGSFQNANTTPRSFERASELIAYGARQQEIIQFVYKTKQLSQLKLWGRVLSKIQTDETHRIVWSVVSQQDFLDTDSNEDETGDIIDELMTNAPNAEIVLLIKEKKDGDVSVSVRTTSPNIDGSRIAEQFGGGGHTQAAGFRFHNTDLSEAEYKVITAAKEFQKARLNLTETTPEKPETDSDDQNKTLYKFEN
ncbi:bifunctional oligoribonuclease/PAP phosphatase NrnA [Candidatus Gracilibacteria bacterium]|nr:bifunctional oligoribonuclease/PAP phosphatase NrnA [Candidatus Gracilibacteria bacterium]